MFSGSARGYECEDCGATYSSFYPTSIIPFALVIYAAFVAWGGFLDSLVASTLAAMGLSLLLSVGSLIGSLWALTSIDTLRLRNNHCRACGGQLVMKGAGFVDSALPARSEVLMYIVIIGVPVALNLAKFIT